VKILIHRKGVLKRVPHKRVLTLVNGKISQDKCLGGHFKFLISIHSPDFLFFIPLKGVLKRVKGNLE
jgi:hypothetical protein